MHHGGRRINREHNAHLIIRIVCLSGRFFHPELLHGTE
jgi:hypothetical protein